MNAERILLLRAVKIAADGIQEGKGPFGAVITLEGEIIAESVNMVTLSKDPTAHAEVLAIREACSVLGTHDLSGCVIYSSCEPCPMCLGAIYWAGIRRVVYASDRHDAEAAGFNDSFIYKEIVLDPSLRKADFIQITDAHGEDVFRKWNEFEGRKQY